MALPRRETAARRSLLDASVNWVTPAGPGALESRYVRREPHYFAAYLSSQTGCRQACRMCHLTATRQTRLRDVTVDELLQQANHVLCHAATQAPAETVHYNFMARGEPLASQVLVERSGEVFDRLWRRAADDGLKARFLVSTILPRSLTRPLEDVFDRYQPEIYYSLYTMSPRLRRRWLPQALPAEEGLDRLVAWQRRSYKIVKLHFAFIDGLNATPADVHAICDAVLARDLFVHVNVVRYNPPTPEHGAEPPNDRFEELVALLRSRLPGRVKVIPRVGPDVYASCGMFDPGPGRSRATEEAPSLDPERLAR
ncbi:MAG: radical SAM enzyme, Cfr family protein [Sandaracinaceae bacterium]